jgi:hypothetical protein
MPPKKRRSRHLLALRLLPLLLLCLLALMTIWLQASRSFLASSGGGSVVCCVEGNPTCQPSDPNLCIKTVKASTSPNDKVLCDILCGREADRLNFFCCKNKGSTEPKPNNPSCQGAFEHSCPEGFDSKAFPYKKGRGEDVQAAADCEKYCKQGDSSSSSSSSEESSSSSSSSSSDGPHVCCFPDDVGSTDPNHAYCRFDTCAKQFQYDYTGNSNDPGAWSKCWDECPKKSFCCQYFKDGPGGNIVKINNFCGQSDAVNCNLPQEGGAGLTKAHKFFDHTGHATPLTDCQNYCVAVPIYCCRTIAQGSTSDDTKAGTCSRTNDTKLVCSQWAADGYDPTDYTSKTDCQQNCKALHWCCRNQVTGGDPGDKTEAGKCSMTTKDDPNCAAFVDNGYSDKDYDTQDACNTACGQSSLSSSSDESSSSSEVSSSSSEQSSSSSVQLHWCCKKSDTQSDGTDVGKCSITTEEKSNCSEWSDYDNTNYDDQKSCNSICKGDSPLCCRYKGSSDTPKAQCVGGNTTQGKRSCAEMYEQDLTWDQKTFASGDGTNCENYCKQPDSSSSSSSSSSVQLHWCCKKSDTQSDGTDVGKCSITTEEKSNCSEWSDYDNTNYDDQKSCNSICKGDSPLCCRYKGYSAAQCVGGDVTNGKRSCAEMYASDRTWDPKTYASGDGTNCENYCKDFDVRYCCQYVQDQEGQRIAVDTSCPAVSTISYASTAKDCGSLPDSPALVEFQKKHGGTIEDESNKEQSECFNTCIATAPGYCCTWRVKNNKTDHDWGKVCDEMTDEQTCKNSLPSGSDGFNYHYDFFTPKDAGGLSQCQEQCQNPDESSSSSSEVSSSSSSSEDSSSSSEISSSSSEESSSSSSEQDFFCFNVMTTQSCQVYTGQSQNDGAVLYRRNFSQETCDAACDKLADLVWCCEGGGTVDNNCQQVKALKCPTINGVSLSGKNLCGAAKCSNVNDIPDWE